MAGIGEVDTRPAPEGPTALVRAAVEALEQRFFEPLDVAELLAEAWEGAMGALARAGVSPVPPAPAYPAGAADAYGMHAETFRALEERASGTLGPEELAAAALRELLADRRDGHTHLVVTPLMPWRQRPSSGARTDFGLDVTDTPPLTVADVRPAGLCGFASRVGLAPGWVIIVTARETVFGPEERRFNRVGVPPDVVVVPSQDDEAAGRDPQLEAALDILRSLRR